MADDPQAATPVADVPAAEPAAVPSSPRDAAKAALREKKAQTPPEETVEMSADPETPAETPPETPIEAPTETPAEGTDVPTEKPADESKPVAVPIDPQHPAAMGIPEIHVADEREERAVRALISGYARKAHVRELKGQLETAQAQITTLEDEKARRDATDGARKEYTQTPEYRQAAEQYSQIAEAEKRGDVPEGAARRFWDSVEGEIRAAGEKAWEARRGELSKEREQRQATAQAKEAQALVEEMWQRQERFPEGVRKLPAFRKVFDSSLRAFNELLKVGEYEHLHDATDFREALHTEFGRFFMSRLLLHPEVSAAVNAARAQKTKAQETAPAAPNVDAIKQQAVEEYKRSLATRQATPPHALGPLSAAARNRIPGEPSGQDEPPADLPPGQVKKAVRERMHERMRQRTGT